VGLFSERRFPAFIREIMVVLCLLHMCFRTTLRKLVLAEFFEEAWLLSVAPQILHFPFMGTVSLD